MNFEKYFTTASLLEFKEEFNSINARQAFYVDEFDSVKINILGLGFFELYINGKKVGNDLFLPLNTDFHEREIITHDRPLNEVFGHRIHVTTYDISEYVNIGKNVISVMIGNGWYSDTREIKFGKKKLVFDISIENKGDISHVVSDTSLRYHEGFVKKSIFTHGEDQDYREYDDNWMEPDFDDSSYLIPQVVSVPDTVFTTTECPPDRVVKTIMPELISEKDGIRTYDCKINSTGRIVLRLLGEKDDVVTIIHSEEKNEDDTIDMDTTWEQKSTFICDGKEREVSVKFTWNGFRFFQVEGKAEVLRAERIHTDCKPCSSFSSKNKVLNWIYNSFINTQLSNMHSGIPSDCPHIERRGYTGDGELAGNAVMTTLDAEQFYRKWMLDISDCQDRITGHVQYTAPYTHSGGGPGGWGCAIVHVPYLFHHHYDDISPMKDMLSGILEYFRYLDDHSENNLVVSDKPDEWCLGDWCTADEIAIPEPFVNTYFYIRSIDEVLTLKNELELSDELISSLNEKRNILVNAINDKYYDPSTGYYCNSIQGANAFAVDIGLGDERTYKQLLDFYSSLGMYDTGIFGTDILTRVLFKNGNSDLAYKLLTSEGKDSFGHMMNQGATSIWEYWYGRRSHSHPMFGAITGYLFEYLLGIKKAKDHFIVSPEYVGQDEEFKGSESTYFGDISITVSYKGDFADISITSTAPVEFSFGGMEKSLTAGTYNFTGIKVK